MKNRIIKSICITLSIICLLSALALDDPQHGFIACIICFISFSILTMFAYANGLLGRLEV